MQILWYDLVGINDNWWGSLQLGKSQVVHWDSTHRRKLCACQIRPCCRIPFWWCFVHTKLPRLHAQKWFQGLGTWIFKKNVKLKHPVGYFVIHAEVNAREKKDKKQRGKRGKKGTKEAHLTHAPQPSPWVWMAQFCVITVAWAVSFSYTGLSYLDRSEALHFANLIKAVGSWKLFYHQGITKSCCLALGSLDLRIIHQIGE